MLQLQSSYRLVLDRTNWKFGTKDINILALAIANKGVDFPIKFRIVPSFGNSLIQGGSDFMDRVIRLFGSSSIECLLADREFKGNI